MVAVDRGRHRDLVAARLHELQQSGLAEHVLKHDAVGPQQQIALARYEFLMFGIVEMAEQHLVGQSQRPAQAAADHGKVASHRRIDRSRHFRRRFDSYHGRAFLADASNARDRAGLRRPAATEPEGRLVDAGGGVEPPPSDDARSGRNRPARGRRAGRLSRPWARSGRGLRWHRVARRRHCQCPTGSRCRSGRRGHRRVPDAANKGG